MPPGAALLTVLKAVVHHPPLLRLQRGDDARLEADVSNSLYLGCHLVDDADALGGHLWAQAIGRVRQSRQTHMRGNRLQKLCSVVRVLVGRDGGADVALEILGLDLVGLGSGADVLSLRLA